MRSLFLKIFLWFWATVVIIGAVLVITWSLQPEIVVSRWRASTGEAISIYAQSAAEEFDRYGPKALGNYFQRLQTSSHVTAALLDEQGNVIAGKLSSNGRQLASEVGLSDQPEFSVHAGSAYAAQRASGPTGRSYIFVAEMPRGPIGAFRPSAKFQALRFLIAVLLSGIICYLLARYLTAPILRLRTAARQLAAGDLSARAGQQMERRRDELGELVRDFNHMAVRIQALLTAQRQLISDISHELRSPLARLTVALELARQRAGGEAATPLDRIEREAERLNELIGRLLTLARLETLSTPPAMEPVDVSDLVNEIAADAAFEAHRRNCEVKVTAPPRCQLLGNPELLRSAIENVVRNAVSYTADGTTIEIAVSGDCSSDAGHATITVRDHGPGLPPSELQNVLRPFYRISSARERKTGGTGLGLAIADRVVKLHGGSIEISNAEKEGLIVTMHLPMGARQAAQPHIAAAT